jgi:hypothetical protein
MTEGDVIDATIFYHQRIIFLYHYNYIKKIFV